MLTETERPSTRILVLAIALSAIGMAGLALRSTSTEPTTTSTSTAELQIGGTSYVFGPTTCTVTDTDFLAAGSGQIDGQDFWISVSPEAAELALGTADERIRSDDREDLWLMSSGLDDWQTTTDRAVTVDLTMRNERMTNAPLLPGRFTANCSS